MPDSLGLLDFSLPLQERYDKFLLWQRDKNYAAADFIAAELGLSISEVDVFLEMGNLDDDEFEIIDEKKFDIGHLFIILRSPRRTRDLIYERQNDILNSSQPLMVLKAIADDNSNYTTIEELVKKVSGNCWKSIANYLKQREIINGTITKNIRSMFMQCGNRVNNEEQLSDNMIGWIIKAINHDKSKSLGVFTNDIIRTNFYDDYIIFDQIMDNIAEYENDK